MGTIKLKINIGILFFVFVMCCVSDMTAQLNVTAIFGNGMVLQREHIIPVWGSGTANETVAVTLNGSTVTGHIGSDSKWKVELPAMNAGGPYTMTITSGEQTITRTDVYIGDVWLASGQSNMEMMVSQSNSAATVIAAANDETIRQFKVPKSLANEPSNDLPTGTVWRPATKAYVGGFTAVGYFFARDLRPEIGVPIGILNISYGGSRIETWMSDAMLGFDEQTKVLANGELERQPTVAFNKMIHPILQYPIKGVIWYQAESNGDSMEDALAYGNLFKTFITGWRELFGLGDIPFLWVQLPNFGEVYEEPRDWDAWPQLRQQQSSALSLPNTGEAITIDVGAVDIHPMNKIPVGQRLALIARKIVYGQDIIYSGPRYAGNILREDGKIEIRFNHIGSGLKAKNSEAGIVQGFAVAGEDNKLVWADAVIENDKVIVWSDQVSVPVKVRYAWEYNPPAATLYNKEDLPAAPFLADVNPGFKITSFTSARSAIETGQSTTLSWMVYGASSITLNGTAVDSAATITITPEQTTTYTLMAVNRDDANEKDTAVVTVEVLDPNQINRAKNHTTTASTFEACCGAELKPELAVDGDMTTRWSSAWQQETATTIADPNLDDNPDDEWISVDLGEAIDIDRIILYWEAAHGSSYDIEVSFDGYIWNKVHEERNGNGGEDNIVFSHAVSGRFVRMHGIQRATQYGYSIYEIAVYGMLSVKKPPVATISTNIGNVARSNSTITIIANTSDADGIVQQTSFYVKGQLLSTDDSSPFTASWIPNSPGEYEITAVVTDDDGITVQADPYLFFVTDGELTKYEAENAVFTGQGYVTNSSSVSGGKFMDMRDAWTLNFNNVEITSAGEYLLIIGYQLTYESPKTQYLVVNGDTVDAVEFTAPNKNSWLQRGIKINLNSDVNQISFHGFWNWMSFDYIAVITTPVVSVKNTNSIPQTFTLDQNYPNPFNPTTNITYSIPTSGHVKLDIYNITGQKIASIINQVENAGKHVVKFYANNISSGVYFYRLQFNSNVLTKSMILLR